MPDMSPTSYPRRPAMTGSTHLEAMALADNPPRRGARLAGVRRAIPVPQIEIADDASSRAIAILGGILIVVLVMALLF
ncbi:hypothetical protein [Frigidibacter oleivorans]|uniref:hypothetical protein n=1 Tax=Frigidibacter oleivorans TaxID=2487129 RepID=UPI000F8D6883|nr:hypothetical protein [Frigidibacter oleivorans]